MQSFAQLAPLIILFPAVGAFINFFWGAKLPERFSAYIGIFMSAMTFVIALLLFAYLGGNNYEAAVIDPPIIGSEWIAIDSVGMSITWQTRVDTLSVAMMLFVTFVGTLIHVYAMGYMHGDPRFHLFFGYLNMFLTFMLILVSANNMLMMFVGWEGVGLCSYLLIGFWWDKANGQGWKNSNAARKAFIVNRIGDFGLLMAMFLIFWTFGTLDFYKPGEIANPDAGAHHGGHGEDDHGDDSHGEEESHGEEANLGNGLVLTTVAMQEEGEEPHGEEEGHGGVDVALFSWQDEDIELNQLGIFGQAKNILESGEEVEYEIGPFTYSFEDLLVLITLFMLLGATGKSAQIPLFVWLPDAMAGPTPVSALIHAATMVTAGVYMMVRANIFFYNAELTSFIVTLVGAGTALVAGYIAVGQWDIKRVLAYSTISQLGFMVAAVGIGAFTAAMFHMITHAFFKALLFLGSGSVIHGVEHGHHHVHAHGHGDDHHDEHDDGHHDDFDPQDMRNMGGLRHKMPVTYITYVFGTLALAGIFPFAGFWSKDEILADGWKVGFADGELAGYIALGTLLLAAGFTAFYMWRQIVLVFHGEPRSEAAEHAPESVASMTTPLVVLAFFSLFIGFINTPSGIFLFTDLFGAHRLGDWLSYSVVEGSIPPFNLFVALLALGLGVGAILTAGQIYGSERAQRLVREQGRDPLQADPNTGQVWGLANARMYWDEIYYRLFEGPYNRLAAFFANTVDWDFLHDYFHDKVIARGYNTIGKLLANPLDLGLIDGAVNGVGRIAQWLSGGMRRTQTGYVRTYALALFLGVVAVILIMLLPLIQG